MVINYVPGVECRVAVLHDGRLEELHSERMDSASRVGNIYVGRVANVESAIQAAFVDFGLEEHGFLHITDLHPRYFPGNEEDEKERVGKKTPRRERPPIQQCLKKGQEVIVQVLKEGIGSKGPTLTSYLSVPGRFLVMMPGMDNVGVSRRVEDEDQRREMRKILDQLELPEGFGFILRTAGMDRNKTELKRDLAYLQRLWRDMERRLNKGKRPRLLYAESDLLVRCLRDVLTTDVGEVVIDDEVALRRASRFLKIVSPRTQTKLLRYHEPTPIFHAFGIEEQIKAMHEREAPIEGGGYLVIDEAEALVAIDVNSGRRRGASDAETNAFRTNMVAADEVCRQLRLRDLGGVVVVDLIDMRSRKHQREIENRFRENLKRDRAHTKVLPISQFGILEMTRQRMRGSHRKAHFAPCPDCEGRGLVQKAQSVLAESLRDLAWILQHDRVKRVEVAVSPRVATEALSRARPRLAALEHSTGKHVDVRVSETIRPDRVAYYAYDANGSDIAIDGLPKPRRPEKLEEWREEGVAAGADWSADPAEEAAEAQRLSAESEASMLEAARRKEAEAILADDPSSILRDDEAHGDGDEEEGGGRKRRRRRRRRGGRGRSGDEPQNGDGAPRRDEDHDEERDEAPERREPVHAEGEEQGDGEEGGGRKRRRRRRRRRGRGGGERQENGEQRREDAHAHEDAHDERPARGDRPLPASQPSSGLRGDSWDLEPVAGRPAPPKSEPITEPKPAPAARIEERDEDGEAQAEPEPADASPKGGRKKRRRRAKRSGSKAEAAGEDGSPAPESDGAPQDGGAEEPAVKKPVRSRKKSSAKAATEDATVEADGAEPKKKTRRRKAAPKQAAESGEDKS